MFLAATPSLMLDRRVGSLKEREGEETAEDLRCNCGDSFSWPSIGEKFLFSRGYVFIILKSIRNQREVI